MGEVASDIDGARSVFDGADRQGCPYDIHHGRI